MQNVRIGRQPVLDSESRLCAYSIMYREDTQNTYSSASVISNVLNTFGVETLLGERRAFVSVDTKFLLHDLILTIPSKFFIFSISNDVEMSERVVERVEELHKRGYILSLDHVNLEPKHFLKYETILKYISYVKVDIRSVGSTRLKTVVSQLKSMGITVVADNIYDSKQYTNARDLGCDWFQGYFFAELKIIENAKYEASQMQVLKLYRLLIEDSNIDEITQEFENNHEVTVQLLQFINSGAFHFRNRISSIHHILTLVGRIPLAQWLMLMIYSKSVSKEQEKAPLMLMVKNRTELMENILKALQPDVRSNMLGEAYFVGVLSLMDVLYGVQLKDLLVHMHVSEEVKNALLKEQGILGEIYALIRHIEKFDTEAVGAFEKKYNLEKSKLNDIILKSMEGVEKFENPRED